MSEGTERNRKLETILAAQHAVREAARRPGYTVLVVAERADGRLMRQHYSSLAAAEKKVARTRERGLCASLALTEHRPIGTLPVGSADVREVMADDE